MHLVAFCVLVIGALAKVGAMVVFYQHHVAIPPSVYIGFIISTLVSLYVWKAYRKAL